MAKVSIGFGIALILLGVVGYFATGSQSPTALIPAGLGLVLVVLGILARNPRLRMHTMHGAALVGLIGFLGSVSGLGQLVKMAAGQTVRLPAAAVSRSIMALLCLAFVALTVRSFIAVRIARKKANEAQR